MIDLSLLTRENIGQKVVYQPSYKKAVPEFGVISSYNQHWIFVWFDNGSQGIACRPENLNFISQ